MISTAKEEPYEPAEAADSDPDPVNERAPSEVESPVLVRILGPVEIEGA
jgi:hypothetical protein